jgi:GGDEF domain-containing protein
MVGGLLTLAALAMLDTLSARSIASVRNLLLVVMTGTTCMVVTGLPEVFWPGIPERVLVVIIVTLVPLSGALTLKYLDIWLGGAEEDVLVHQLIARGAGMQFFAALALGLLATQVSSQYFHQLRAATTVICVAAVLLGFVVTIRSALLGDPLARWMVLACVCLAAMVAGLALRGLDVKGYGVGTWIATALCTVGYFVIVTGLAILRNRQNRKLKRLAGLKVGADPATGLSTGSVLLSEVERAFWRTARMNGECTVVCLHLSNLYELGEAAGHGVEHQILAAMAARIRRAAGFRCVVGLYHPRCFVVVISGHQRRQYVNLTVARLRVLIAEPLSVVGRDQTRHDYTPRLGVGVVTVDPANADPLEVINKAERLALVPLETPPQSGSQDNIATAW